MCRELLDSPALSCQDKEMDQGGLKCNGNRDDSLTFGEAGVGLVRDTGDTAGSLLQPAMHLPGSGSLPLSTVSPNGQSGTKDQVELGGLYESPQHHIMSDMKDGKGIRMQKPQQQQQQQQPHQDIDLYTMDNLQLLRQSMPDLNQTSTSVINTSANSVLGNQPLPDLFPGHIKQEGNFSLDKDFSGHAGVVPGDLDGNSSHPIEDTEIWQDLDLPNSLPEISDFEVVSEVAHLDNILHDSRGGGVPVSGLLKEMKPLMGNGVNGNGSDPIQHHPQQQQHHLLQHQQHQLHHQQPTTLLSSVMIKEEKDPDDSFIHIRTPGVVKHEKQDNGAFCQAQCLQGGMSSMHGGGGGPMPSSMGIGAGPGYHYRASSSAAAPVGLPDQKPFGMYSNLAQVGEAWARGGRYGEAPGIQRPDDGLPSAALSSFPVSFPR